MSKETEDYVRAVASTLAVPIPAEYLPGTVLNFERSAALAKTLMDFPLPMDIHPAPTYEP